MPVVLLEFVLVLFVAYVGATQILWPVWRGTPMFPMFQREQRLHWEIGRGRQRQVELKLEQDLKRMEADDNARQDDGTNDRQ
jgi:hypothetical protein